MYLNSVRRRDQWDNPASFSRVSRGVFAQWFSWVCIFTATRFTRALPFDTLFIRRLRRRVRARRRSIKSHSPSRFPRREGRGRGKREQLPVFSGRLDLMIFSSVTRGIPRGDGHRRRLYGMRSAKRAKRSYEWLSSGDLSSVKVLHRE